MDSALTVLCVDDDPGLLEVLETFLERHDQALTVHTATTASEGLELLHTEAVDCVVSDYEMPGVDGLEFLVLVRAEYPILPFVLFTGQGSEDIASDAITAGVTDYMQKRTGTAQYEVLARRVRNAVERVRALERLYRTSEQIRPILDETPLPVVVRMDARLVYVNHAAVEFFEADDESDLLGTTPDELLAPSDQAEYERDVADTERGKPGVTRVTRHYRTLRGNVVSAAVTGRPLTWEGSDALVAILRPDENGTSAD